MKLVKNDYFCQVIEHSVKMEQKTSYVAPTVKSIIMNARRVICLSPGANSESFEDIEVVDLDE